MTSHPARRFRRQTPTSTAIVAAQVNGIDEAESVTSGNSATPRKRSTLASSTVKPHSDCRSSWASRAVEAQQLHRRLLRSLQRREDLYRRDRDRVPSATRGYAHDHGWPSALHPPAGQQTTATNACKASASRSTRTIQGSRRRLDQARHATLRADALPRQAASWCCRSMTNLLVEAKAEIAAADQAATCAA